MARTAIIGLGITGLSCLKYLHAKTDLVVVDSRTLPPCADGARQAFPDVDYRFGVEAFDYAGVDEAVVSPGVAMDGALVAPARELGVRLRSDIDMFLRAATAPVVAITGTNGKSTVTALTGHLLRVAGRNVGVGGNLGEPALDLLDDARDGYVLELSSFQLERLEGGGFAVASILNVTEDHIDRHGSLDRYAASKQRVYRDCAHAVVNRHDARTVPQAQVPRVVSFGIDAPGDGDWGVSAGVLGRRQGDAFIGVVPIARLPLAGRHNVLNTLAACALAHAVGVDVADLVEGVLSFAGLPHRCQRIGRHDGVTYIDDSKATNVGATVAALEGLGDAQSRKVVLIAGGDGKGADFTPLREPVSRYVKGVVLMGKDADLLARAFGSEVPLVRASDMSEAVREARAQARAGDIVLLSPACASLDMFEDFQARGRCFAAAVRAAADPAGGAAGSRPGGNL